MLKMLGKNKMMFGIILVRLAHFFIVQSYYVPDEYWQTLEVAHKLVFGYGHLTWEWVEGIRSYLYVSWIAVIYNVLQWFNMDTVYNLTTIPRVVQTLFTIVSDIFFIKWCKKCMPNHVAKLAISAYLSNWFVAFCASRTLTNTAEMNLTCIALYYFPWLGKPNKPDSTKYLWFVGLACILRPTAAVVWFPLCGFAISESPYPWSLVLKKYLPIVAVLLTGCTLLDSYFYGDWIFTWWNFAVFNVWKNVSAEYSTHSWYWYIVHGIPAILTFHCLPILASLSAVAANHRHPVYEKCVKTAFFAIFVLSLIPHKEYRFLLPLVPILVAICAFGTKGWAVNMELPKNNPLFTYKAANAVLLTLNTLIVFYLGLYYQRGTLDIMHHIPRDPNHDLLFLMPCHSTPLYSHLHVNTTARFLHCEPNLTGDRKYEAEVVQFYKNPNGWLAKEYPDNAPASIICFNILLPKIKYFLDTRKYSLKANVSHTRFDQSDVFGPEIHVYTRFKKKNIGE